MLGYPKKINVLAQHSHCSHSKRWLALMLSMQLPYPQGQKIITHFMEWWTFREQLSKISKQQKFQSMSTMEASLDGHQDKTNMIWSQHQCLLCQTPKGFLSVAIIHQFYWLWHTLVSCSGWYSMILWPLFQKTSSCHTELWHCRIGVVCSQHQHYHFHKLPHACFLWSLCWSFSNFMADESKNRDQIHTHLQAVGNPSNISFYAQGKKCSLWTLFHNNEMPSDDEILL